jgi:myo-inositol-1(or 4)-monophosphatase
VADDFALAASLVLEAGRLTDRMRREGVGVEYKTSISDVVTAADRAAEALVVERLRAERPADGLVGEEGARHPGQRTWFIDPLDGTFNFTSGLPTWCAAIALVEDSRALLGAVYHPAADELWLGGAGQTTTCNDEPVVPLGDPRLADVCVASYLHPTTLPDDTVREPLLRAIGAAATVRMLGSGSVELASVAAGRLGGFVQYDCLPWDWYPGAALVEGAGGVARVLELAGHRWHLAGPARVVAELEATLRA